MKKPTAKPTAEEQVAEKAKVEKEKAEEKAKAAKEKAEAAEQKKVMNAHAKEIKKSSKAVSDNKSDMAAVHALGTVLNTARDDFVGSGWSTYVSDTCGVDETTGRRAMRIARMLTEVEAVELKSISKSIFALP